MCMTMLLLLGLSFTVPFWRRVMDYEPTKICQRLVVNLLTGCGLVNCRVYCGWYRELHPDNRCGLPVAS
jgi:hypothetical protein